MMTAAEIRAHFLQFFNSRSHLIVPSAPLVVKNDPTLMFTNAGMNQFKDFFLGNKTPQNRRIADTQKCLRVSGKHNDLEEVGLDTYHHTMFEMLGNWSFGDYFKKEAIAWSWELLTKVYQLNPEKLYATVFEGASDDGLPADDESFAYWKENLPESQILYGNKKDNFWEMGDTGPCGPCTEIHIDLRSEEEIAKTPGRDLVNTGHPLVVEIWNNVFIEFNRLSDGSLQQLPDKHVDTGMGFERLCMAIQGKQSNYDTDVFTPLIQFVEKQSGFAYHGAMSMEKTDIAMRVLADHIRAIAFTIADGQLPSNVKAGYVIRRILRRAVRYYFNFLNISEPFLCKMVEVLAKQFEHVFPELFAQKDFVAKVIQEEESSFLRTLEIGLKKINTLIDQTKTDSKATQISGKAAFELYDTFGFPYDLTALIARENNLEVDEAAFLNELQIQKARSRKADEKETGDWVMVNEDGEQEFIGYDALESQTRVLKYRMVQVKDKKSLQLVIESCPFYGESGGQVGDKGTLSLQHEGKTLELKVADTKKENDLLILMLEGVKDAAVFQPETLVAAKVNATTRLLTSSNHSATHLLHSALRNTLGTHVAQKGSLVSEEVLRFDFAHFSKVADVELEEIEAMVNARIRQNIALEERRNVPIAKAKEMGATALFGEKYGDFVRVITFDASYSVELCGGTHVKNTGEIGYFKILSESSVAAGVRRIEAVTSHQADVWVKKNEATIAQVNEILNHPKDIAKALQNLLDDKAQLLKKLEVYELNQKNQEKERLKTLVVEKGGINQIIALVSVGNAEMLRQLCFELRNEFDNLFCVLAAEIDAKPQLAVIIADELVASKNLNASLMARELGKEIKGGGGGQPFFATAGGSDAGGLVKVIEKAKSLLA